MQFFVIHHDPIENAKMLPNWALRVNVHEGWQMLSDIGHAHDTVWQGQNKEYNRFHPNTWKWWKQKHQYIRLMAYYVNCLNEHKTRFGKKTVFHERYNLNFYKINSVTKAIRDMSEEEAMVFYMLSRKSKNMTDIEYDNLLEYYPLFQPCEST